MVEAYEAWASALLEELFPWSEDPGEVYLAIDAERLRTIGRQVNESGDPLESFNRAVREQVVVQGKFQIERITSDRKRPFQQLPFLALCVLAAGEMRTSNELRHIASTNYYARLNEMLGLEAKGKHPSLKGPEIENEWYLLQERLRSQG